MINFRHVCNLHRYTVYTTRHHQRWLQPRSSLVCATTKKCGTAAAGSCRSGRSIDAMTKSNARCDIAAQPEKSDTAPTNASPPDPAVGAQQTVAAPVQFSRGAAGRRRSRPLVPALLAKQTPWWSGQRAADAYNGRLSLSMFVYGPLVV